jgi:hypothetical protein
MIKVNISIVDIYKKIGYVHSKHIVELIGIQEVHPTVIGVYNINVEFLGNIITRIY